MGNRTCLVFDARCEFEANNCLPVTWLALFDTDEFLVEIRQFEHERPRQRETVVASRKGILASLCNLLNLATRQPILESTTLQPAVEVCWEDCEVAVFKTCSSTALERVERVIKRLRGQTPIWTFLRPLEILERELQKCSPDDSIELDVTQLWAMDNSITERVVQGPKFFAKMLASVSGEVEHDLALLDKFVTAFSLAREESVRDLDSEMKMFVLLGSYSGEESSGQPYPLEYFNDAYWAGSG
jgi:hypothetical protein